MLRACLTELLARRHYLQCVRGTCEALVQRNAVLTGVIRVSPGGIILVASDYPTVSAAMKNDKPMQQ